MGADLLLRNVRPMGGPTIDVLVTGGRIDKMAAAITAPNPSIHVLDGGNQLLLPGLVNAHAHIDKNLLGRPWHRNELRPTRLQDLTDNERRLRREMRLSTREQSAREAQAAIAAGTTHIRTHVDVDTDAGLAHIEGVMATREEVRDAVTMQIVAFPQSGMLVRPGTVELLEEAIRMGAECIGGLDPSAVDGDPVRHLDVVFGMADRHGVEVDVHLHEPGVLGAFAVELIAERTRALGLQGRVTISHVFCLGMVDDAYLARLIELLLENRIAIMSLGSGTSAFPPLGRLHEAGVTLCTGTDGVRDTWGPYGQVDMLERVRLLGYRTGSRRDDEIELLLKMATHGGARVMGDGDYGLEIGKRADFVVVPAETPAHAVVERPLRAYVVKGGRLVAANGATT
jgi:cytosine/adenosine deaminase-related metal-dependent hydrolase